MPETEHSLRSISWSECFPFTNIFRTFRLAAQPGKLVLALAILIITFAWGCVLDALWSAAGYAPLVGEVHGYPAVVDYQSWRNAYAGQKDDALVSFMTQVLKSSRSPEEIAKEIKSDRETALQNARKLLGERYKKLIDLDERRKAESEMLNKLPEDQREAKLAEMVAASREEHRALQNQLATLGHRGVFAEWRNYQAHYVNETFQAIRRLNFYREADFAAITPRRSDVGTIQAAVAGSEPFIALSAAANLCMMGRGVAWMLHQYPCFAVFFLLGTLAIWAFFGGAICRIAAMHATRDEQISPIRALRFACRKFIGFFTAPLIIDVLVLLFGFLLLIGGLVAGIPVLDILGGIIFLLALITGAVMALLIIGGIGGFSLMWPTIAVEGSDAFDAISRSYSYVLDRPWRSLFYAAVAALYGAFCILFVRIFIWLALL
jgi:hypothetical protein